MTNWNPSPTVLGMQVVPWLVGNRAVTALGRAHVTYLGSSVAETITGIEIPSPGGNPGNTAFAGIDVYPADQFGNIAGDQMHDFLPSADAGGAGGSWERNPGGSTTNIYQNIRSNPDNPNTDNSIIETSGLVGASKHFNVSSGNFSTSKRITRVDVRVHMFGGSIRCALHGPGGARTDLKTTGFNSSMRTVTFNFGEICPWTELPWRQEDIQLFASEARIVIARDDRSSSILVPQIYAMALRVHTWNEYRVGYGAMKPTGSSTMHRFDLRDPATGEIGWEKPGSGEFVYVLRGMRGGPRISETKNIEPEPYIRSAYFLGEVPTGFNHGGSANLSMTGGGQPGNVSARARNMISAIVLKRDDDEFSVDGSEYSSLSNFGPSMRQVFAPGPGGEYGSITAVVRPPLVGADDPITFQVQTMGGAALGSMVSITRSDLLREGRHLPGSLWWEIRAPIDDPAVLEPDTQYRVQISGSSGWRVMTLGGSNDHGNAGYGGFDGYVDYFSQTGARDAAVTLGMSPPKLEGLTVTERSLPLARTAPGGNCPAYEEVGYVRVMWEPTEVPEAEFGRYEVERYDGTSGGWHQIASIGTRTVTAVDDHEARFGVASSYRVRVVQEDGTPSAWSGDTTGGSTVTLSPPAGPGLWFTSSLVPELGCGYMDVYGARRAERPFTLNDGATTNYVRYFGRDYQVAHRPTEKRGVTFSRRLLIDAESTVLPSMDAFEPMRRLTTSELPVITVRDHEGNRWWAWVDMPSATITIGGYKYADVTVTETADRPVPVTESNLILGGGWETLAGGFGADEAGAFVARTEDGIALAALDTGRTDGAIAAQMVDTDGPSNAMGIAVRVVDENNYIYVFRNSSFSQGRIYKVVGGVATYETIGGLGDKFTVEVAGSSTEGGTVVRVLRDGVESGSMTINEAVFDGETRHGIVYTRAALPTGTTRWARWRFYTQGGTLGAGWESWGGSTWRIENGRATRFAIGGNAQRAVSVLDTGLSDGRIRTSIENVQNRTRIVFRAKDEDNYLYIRASTTFNQWILYSRVDGVETDISNLGGPAGGDLVIEIYLYGDKVRFRFDGSFKKRPGSDAQTFTLPPEVAFLEDETRHGFGDDGGHFDGESGRAWSNFRVEPLRHWGVNGSSLMSVPSQRWIGRQVDVFQLEPLLGPDDAVALMWGVNDAISMSAGWFAEGLEAVVSKLAMSSSIDARLIHPRTGTWSEVSGDGHNSGDGWLESSDPGATATFSFKAPPGGVTVVLGFIAVEGDGVAEVTWGGVTETVEIDRGEWGFEPMFARRRHLEEGDQQIVIEVVSGKVAVDSLWTEGDMPRVAIANVARFLQGADFTASGATETTVSSVGAGWTVDKHVGATARIYEGPGAIQDRVIVSNTASTVTVAEPWSTVPVPGQSRIHINQIGSPWGNITDRKIADMNEAIAGVAAKFPNATVVDIDDVLDRDPAMFSGDGIHPSRDGHDALGAAFTARLGAHRTWRSLWVFGHSYSAGQGGGPFGFDYQLARRLTFEHRVLDGFDRRDDRGADIDGRFGA